MKTDFLSRSFCLLESYSVTSQMSIGFSEISISRLKGKKKILFDGILLTLLIFVTAIRDNKLCRLIFMVYLCSVFCKRFKA